jgi:hypothetical protein
MRRDPPGVTPLTVKDPNMHSTTRHTTPAEIRWSVHFQGIPEELPRLDWRSRTLAVEKIHGTIDGHESSVVAKISGRYVNKDGSLHANATAMTIWRGDDTLTRLPHPVLQAIAEAVRRQRILAEFITAQGWGEC